jgi:circadian clock protein KaiC
MKNEPKGIPKARTGIAGFDELSGGGIPKGRTTLIAGGSGCGKSVFALQALVYGAAEQREPGIFVASEEHAGRIVANAATFTWNLGAR